MLTWHSGPRMRLLAKLKSVLHHPAEADLPPATPAEPTATPMSATPTRLPLRRAWELLERREHERARLARGDALPLRAGLADAQRFAIHASRQHRADNRYSDVNAYDRTAVRPRGEFLNASVVGDGSGRWWVAAQAPLDHTRYAFFRALLDGAATQAAARLEPELLRPTSGGEAILVQLTGWVERGIEKACPYMPKDGASDLTFKSAKHDDAIHLHLSSQERKPDLGSVYTELEVGDGSSTMKLHHYFFAEWPDHGVPEGEHVACLRRLVEDIARRSGTDKGELDQEVWVHCSAGVGRTGTFIALSSLFFPRPRVYEAEDLEDLEGDNVAETVEIIRRSRNILVQAPQQLKLIYDMMEEHDQRQE